MTFLYRFQKNEHEPNEHEQHEPNEHEPNGCASCS